MTSMTKENITLLVWLLQFVLLAAAAGTENYLVESCSGRCGDSADFSWPCQCNTLCVEFRDCCIDYSELCEESTTEVTNEELLTISEVLWDSDSNRLSDSQYALNMIRRVQNSAHPKLFSFVNLEAIGRNTFALFASLLDNYEARNGIAEPDLTPIEEVETDDFLNACLNTPVMHELYSFLYMKGFVFDLAEFRSLLYSLWFEFYPRSSSSSAAVDSSGFEHVFVGEKKSNKVNGFHNWLQTYFLESTNDLIYQGYNSIAEPRLMNIRISWNGLAKSGASMFIGTSPEFEMALYTLCMVTRPGSVCNLRLEGHPVRIQTYDVSHKPGLQVATAYPVAPAYSNW